MNKMDDLDKILDSIKDFLPEAGTAHEQSLAAEVPLAEKLLGQIASSINEQIAQTSKSLIWKSKLAIDSPTISVIVAVLRRKKYVVRVDGDTSYTQFIIEW